MRNDTRAEWQALLDLGMLWAERDYDRTGEHYRAALAIARVAGDASMTAYSLNRIANWHVNRDAPAAAIPLHQEALSIFEAIDDRQGIAYTLDFLGVASFVDGDWPASQRYYERAIGLLRQLGDQQRLSSSLSTMIVSGGTLSRDVAAPVYREAAYWLRHSDEGISLARSIGWAAGESYGLINRSLGTAVRGDLGRSLRDACAALATAERIEHGLWTIFARYAVGVIRTELLDTERAAADIEQALAEARVSRTRIFIVAAATALATLRFDEGRLDQAEAILETAIRQDELQPSITQRGCWFVQARLELARGKPDRALAIVERLDRLSRSATTGHAVPHLMFLRGAALEMLGHHSAADASYQAARDSAALFGFLPILWRIDAARGGLFRVAGRDSDASAAYSAARDTVDAIAASIDDDAVRTRFRTQATARLPDRDADVRPAGLSPRELEVLRLVAEGRTDQEIADVLFISRRTVHRHVTAILNKTGTRTRTSAAALAIRLGIV